MKVKNICIVAGMLIATLIIFAGCADGIAACPTVEGEEANFFAAAGNNGTPFAVCGGYEFARASCPSADGWRITTESKSTSTNNDGTTVTTVYCNYGQ